MFFFQCLIFLLQSWTMGAKSWSLQILLCLNDTIQGILMACRFQMRGETFQVCGEHTKSSTDDKGFVRMPSFFFVIKSCSFGEILSSTCSITRTSTKNDVFFFPFTLSNWVLQLPQIYIIYHCVVFCVCVNTILRKIITDSFLQQ